MPDLRPRSGPSDSDDVSQSILAFSVIMNVLAWIAISLRFWSRAIGSGPRASTRHVHRFWWDDWVALLAMPFIQGTICIVYATLYFGLGRHLDMIERRDFIVFIKLLFSFNFLFAFSLCSTRCSALLFLSRIFPWHANPKWFNYSLVGAHFLNVSFLLAAVLSITFICHPISRQWNVFGDGSCGSITDLWIAVAIPGVCVDLLILVLPVPKVWSLQMTRPQKLRVSGVFVVGYSVIIVSIGRVISLIATGAPFDDITCTSNIDSIDQREGAKLFRFLQDTIVPASYWIVAQGPVTLLCICFPAMSSLNRHLVETQVLPLKSKIRAQFAALQGKTSSDEQTELPDPLALNDVKSGGLRAKPAYRPRRTSPDDEHHSLRSESSTGHLFPRKAEKFFFGTEATAAHNPKPRKSSEQFDADPSAIRVDRVVTVTNSSMRGQT
ncbi:hypothetical protein AAL_05302 [Moelleriella libera RCEF 2490]|uniref:Rhodopsin domain-containing protein n=1 Tax=Moelleriella libera RCEF 2490 TaxID=1081109 RepID=A0A168ATL2_9HYPO|nr:hypothetical protein AAL_05302 [Moelleriella libera RCEF 2490]